MSEMKKAWLLLQDGTLLTGRNFGASGTVMGEVVFSTSMTGYQEALTDPNYYGQIMIQTFPMMGNYGVNSEDFSGKAFMKGCIVREWCDTPSNFRMEGDINSFLKEQNIVGLCDLDTRSLTAKLRDKGTMNGMITTEEITDIDAALKALAEYKIEGAVSAVTAVTPAQPENSGGKKVAVMNFGSTVSAVRELVNRGCDVTLHTACEGIEAFESAEGVLLSEGPGDPAENTEAIALIKALIEKKVPLFGIGLGHQLLALAMGAKTETFAGLSGIGDLIATCVSVHSRNHRAGMLIGQGKSVEEAEREISMVVEGIKAAKTVYHLSEKYGVEMPISNEVYKVAFEGRNVQESISDLMGRKLKPEI